jgi:hypothetical protein
MTKPEDDLPQPLRSRAFKRFDEGCATAVIVVFFLLPATAVAVPFLILKRFPALATPIEGGRYAMTTLGTWVWVILTVLPSAVFIWWRRRRFRELHPPEAEPGPPPARRVVAPAHPAGAVGVLLRVWGAMFLLMGMVVLGVCLRIGITRVVPAWREARASHGWPSTPGVIVESRLETGQRRDLRAKVRARIRYAYTTPDGVRREGTRLHFGVDTTWGERALTRGRHEDRLLGEQREAQSALQRFPVGAPVTVIYDPGDPAHAALNRGIGIRFIIDVTVTIFGLLMGAGICWVGWKLLTRRAAPAGSEQGVT